MVITTNTLRAQLIALTNFSGPHKEHADKYVLRLCFFCFRVDLLIEGFYVWKIIILSIPQIPGIT